MEFDVPSLCHTYNESCSSIIDVIVSFIFLINFIYFAFYSFCLLYNLLFLCFLSIIRSLNHARICFNIYMTNVSSLFELITYLSNLNFLASFEVRPLSLLPRKALFTSSKWCFNQLVVMILHCCHSHFRSPWQHNHLHFSFKASLIIFSFEYYRSWP